jgi:Spy/CpxP family protein refolding chaperone
MKRLVFSSIAALILAAPLVTFSQTAGTTEATPERRVGAGRLRERMQAIRERRGASDDFRAGRRNLRAELGLTDLQKAEIRKGVETARRERLRKSTDLRIAKMDLRSLMQAEKVDEKAVSAKLAEVQAAQAALTKLRVDSALAMKRILTPEQQKKMAEFRADRRGAHRDRRGSMRRRMRSGELRDEMRLRGRGRDIR